MGVALGVLHAGVLLAVRRAARSPAGAARGARLRPLQSRQSRAVIHRVRARLRICAERMSLSGPPGVGLALLLQPMTSAVVMPTVCTVVGTAYPVYQSLKCLENDRADESDVQWMTYWVVYGMLGLVEGASDKLLGWFPMYYHAKFAVRRWLRLPRRRAPRC